MSDLIPLYGFLDDGVFLTKGGAGTLTLTGTNADVRHRVRPEVHAPRCEHSDMTPGHQVRADVARGARSHRARSPVHSRNYAS